MSASEAADVDGYIDAQPPSAQDALREIRRRILGAVPDAVESIRYGMPAYRFPNGHPVYFAAWKHHVSLHDIPPCSPELETAIAPFRSGKDTLKFPHTRPIPFDLITDLAIEIASRGGDAPSGN